MLHAFVVLAASSGAVAGLSGARDLLTEALEIWDQRFFDDAAGMFVDSWNRDFTHLDDYRGVNGNMHAVEALLAAADVTDHVARACSGNRSPGGAGVRPAAFLADSRTLHFSWEPQLEHNRDRPDDQFQPYGATVGHGLEWSRLLLHLEASLGIRRTGCSRPPRRSSIVPWSTAGRSMVRTASSTPPIGTARR